MPYLLALLLIGLGAFPCLAQRVDAALRAAPAGFHWQPLPEA